MLPADLSWRKEVVLRALSSTDSLWFVHKLSVESVIRLNIGNKDVMLFEGFRCMDDCAPAFESRPLG